MKSNENLVISAPQTVQKSRNLVTKETGTHKHEDDTQCGTGTRVDRL